MSEVIEILTDALDELDKFQYLSMESAVKINGLRKKLNRAIELIHKNNEKSLVVGVDGQEESLDEWEYGYPENDYD